MKNILFLLFAITFSSHSLANRYTLFTPDSARNAQNETKAEALFLEVIREAFGSLDLEVKIKKGPWIKAQRTVSRSKPQDNYLIAPITRTPEREDKYDWIMPLASYDLQFVTTDPNLDLADIEAIKKQEICVLRESAAEYKLKEWNFPDIISRVQQHKCFEDLKDGKRKVILAHGARIAKAIYKQVNGDPSKLIFGRPFSTHTVYMAATKSAVSENLKQRLLEALDAMKISGRYAEIFSRYE